MREEVLLALNSGGLEAFDVFSEAVSSLQRDPASSHCTGAGHLTRGLIPGGSPRVGHASGAASRLVLTLVFVEAGPRLRGGVPGTVAPEAEGTSLVHRRPARLRWRVCKPHHRGLVRSSI